MIFFKGLSNNSSKVICLFIESEFTRATTTFNVIAITGLPRGPLNRAMDPGASGASGASWRWRTGARWICGACAPCSRSPGGRSMAG